MQAVLDLGADIINDIWALRWRDAPDGLDGRQVVAQHPRCGVCLMHMHREPQTMQAAPMEGDVVPQVGAEVRVNGRIVDRLRSVGVSPRAGVIGMTAVPVGADSVGTPVEILAGDQVVAAEVAARPFHAEGAT